LFIELIIGQGISLGSLELLNNLSCLSSALVLAAFFIDALNRLVPVDPRPHIRVHLLAHAC
jgi:hypothetical protein